MRLLMDDVKFDENNLFCVLSICLRTRVPLSISCMKSSQNEMEFTKYSPNPRLTDASAPTSKNLSAYH